MATGHVLSKELKPVIERLQALKNEGKVLLAYLYGSYKTGTQHARSDIDLALYLNAVGEKEEMEVIDHILMASDKEIGILRLDDEDESPFIVQEALKGIPIVEPDLEAYYKVAHRALHEAESLRFRRERNNP